MKKTFFIIALLVSTLHLFCQTDEYLKWDDDEYLKWSADKPITWDNFKGKSDSAGFEGAIINSDIYLHCEVTEDYLFEVRLYAVMNTNKSYVVTKSEWGLCHERIHFDISELNTRLCRKIIEEYLKTTDEPDCEYISSCYEEIRVRNRNMQVQYDKETNHSLNIEKQKEWEQKIKKQLEELKMYAEPKEG